MLHKQQKEEKLKQWSLAQQKTIEQTPTVIDRAKEIVRKGKAQVPMRTAFFQYNLLMSQEGKCFYCDTPFDEQFPPEFEHIIPKSAGGKDEHWNIVLACQPCNHIKGIRVYETREQARESVRELIRQRYTKVCSVSGPPSTAIPQKQTILQQEVRDAVVLVDAQKSNGEESDKGGGVTDMLNRFLG